VLLLRYTGAHDAFGLILDFTGSIANSITSFIMPAAMYLQLLRSDAAARDHIIDISKNNNAGANAMFAFGVFVMIIVPIFVIS